MIWHAWAAPALFVALGLGAIAVDDVASNGAPVASRQLLHQPGDSPAMTRVADGDPMPLTRRAGSTQTASRAGANATGRQIWAHLASYRSRARAMKGWAELRRTHYPLLEGCAARVTRGTPRKGKGVYYRLGCGGLANLDEGRWLCAQLRKDGQYCMPLRSRR